MGRIQLNLDEICKITNGKILEIQASSIEGVSTDSRTLRRCELFIPLVGDNFDGHKFLEEAQRKGAGCILTSQHQKNLGVSTIWVPDTLKALQDLAHTYRRSHPFQIVGITGSNGKTTTKFFTETLLSPKYSVFASQKSFNNHIGVPLTLLSLESQHQYGICEIGMNHSGEISRLTQLADPDISLCTVVGRAHLMDFGKVDGIYNEKKEIYKSARTDNKRVFNLDNEWTQKMHSELKNSQTLTFSSRNSKADVHLFVLEDGFSSLVIQGHIQGVSGEVRIPIHGAHHVTNLMGASAVALHAGLSPQQIWEGLPSCRTTWGRTQVVPLESQATLIFDGYNANPDSVQGIIESLERASGEGRKFLILGDMLEMGDMASSLHKEVGELAGRKNLDVICFVGQFFEDFERGLRASGFSKTSIVSESYEDSLAMKLSTMIQPNDILVLKGSRGSRMERFIPFLHPKDPFKPNT